MSRLAILRAYLRQRRLRFKDRAALDAFQRRRVEAHLREILPKSPYTAARLGERGAAGWQDLEPIGKAEMMANFDQLNTVGLRVDEALAVAMEAEETRDFKPELGGLTVGLSSGTSGHRGVFVASPDERYTWAGTILAKLLPQPLLWPHRDRLAFFLRANSNLYETSHSRRLSFNFFDLLDPLETHVARLNALQPTLLIAPPSMLLMLSEALEAGDLEIRPDKVISVAEVLDPMDERRLRRVFRSTIHQVYQATEGFLGSSCAFGTMHLAEDRLRIDREYVGERRFHPIITDFNRTSQPIIRYLLNDLLVEREYPCLCGSPLLAIEHIEGRADDVFKIPAREGADLRAIFPDFIRRAVLTGAEGVEAYGVRQIEALKLAVYLRCAPGIDAAQARAGVEAALQAALTRQGCAEVAFEALDDWPKGGLRKLKRVERVYEP